ncbi:MAG: aminotransferase class V-fold PLP-dependent enzyme [Chloroflexota bacterium]|nr:MAG: aminotransferase class V-fold PLP-dependent enzyme [Chloroflexota bacterium]
METAQKVSIFERIGVKPVINAKGFNTVVGGNTPSARMREAIAEVERYYVDMQQLLAASGRAIATMMGAPAAYVTPGAAAALSLGTAACMTGSDIEKMAQLPDTTGLKDTVLIQRPMVYQYDRAVSVHGAKLVEVGSPDGCSADDLTAAIDDRTVAILFPAHLDELPNIVSLDAVIQLAHSRGVRVIVDAAAQVYPVERFLSFPKTGADLIAYSCKYFGGANSSGILCGDAELISAASMQGFIGFEHQTNRKGLGRGYKIDRQEVVCAVVAVEDWLSMDHDRRLGESERRIATVSRGIENASGVTLRLIKQRGAGPRLLHIVIDPALAKRSAEDVFAALQEGTPMIYVNRGPNTIIVNPEPLRTESDVEFVATRLRQLLA